MVFNSLHFAFFLPPVMITYYLLPHRWRWLFMLIASYYFYMCWNAFYAVLILFTTLVDYSAGIMMERSSRQPGKKKLFLSLSIIANLGLLFSFKYFNFFSENISSLLDVMGVAHQSFTLKVLLPVGISFYTFQSISYSLDVYYGQRSAERNLGYFALFIIYFPQLLAGPIERSSHILPQLKEDHQPDFQKFGSALKLMAWGYFKKLVIADRLSCYVDEVFNHPQDYFGAHVALAAFFFSFQVYCDFSGYTDIARGTARLFGVELMENFKQPYLSKSITEIWTRWHISLGNWIKHYIYSPLTFRFRNLGKSGVYLSLFITFTIVGFWHGANWTFLIYGFLQGVFLTFELASKKFRKKMAAKTPFLFSSFITIPLTFIIWTLCCVLFRSNNIADAGTLFRHMFSRELFSANIGLSVVSRAELLLCLALPFLLETVTYLHGRYHLPTLLSRYPVSVRMAAYLFITISIVLLGRFSNSSFIYFQF